jgi:hypothetical protein
MLNYTVGNSSGASFDDKYCSENSKLFTTQTTYEVTTAFIFLSYLQPKMKKKRLAFAKKYLNWT